MEQFDNFLDTILYEPVYPNPEFTTYTRWLPIRNLVRLNKKNYFFLKIFLFLSYCQEAQDLPEYSQFQPVNLESYQVQQIYSHEGGVRYYLRWRVVSVKTIHF